MDRAKGLWSGRWWLPIWCGALGAVVSVAQLIAGNGAAAALTAAIFAVATLAFWAAERSETLQGIGGTQGDERFQRIETFSMAWAGRAMALAVVIAWVVEIARGDDGTRYAWILGVGTLAYLAAMAWIRRRI